MYFLLVMASEQDLMAAPAHMPSFAFLLFVRTGRRGQVWPRAGHAVGAQTMLAGGGLPESLRILSSLSPSIRVPSGAPRTP